MITLPWTEQTAPHLVLDVGGACNISCVGCYKKRDGGIKPLAAIRRDLKTALRLRRVHTVSIAGAEPTLHPRLAEIVALVRRSGLRAALITNGLRLDDTLLGNLRKEGLNVVMVHVDEGQRRPDLPAKPTEEEVNGLRRRLTRFVAAHGIDTGLSVTIYRPHLERLPGLLRLVAEEPHIHYLFATSHVDFAALVEERNGRHAHSGGEEERKVTIDEITCRVHSALGISPFASLPRTGQGSRRRSPWSWVTYFLPVLSGKAKREILKVRSGRMDRFLLGLPRWLSGRHIFYCSPRPAIAVTQVLASWIAEGRVPEALRLLGRLGLGRESLSVKRLVFDGGVDLTEDGRASCGDFCPNATIRDGRLFPVCLKDIPELHG